MDTSISQLPLDHQWSLYKLYRSNALWFCKQQPASLALHKQIDPKTGELGTKTISISWGELQANTDDWIAKMRSLWSSGKFMDTHGIGEKCYCPECAIEEMKTVKQKEIVV